MSAVWIDGRRVAADIKQRVSEQAQALAVRGVVPHLAVVLVGENPESLIYLRNKENACKSVGFRLSVLRLSAQCSQTELEQTVAAVSGSTDVHGVLVQLPLPAHLDARRVLRWIDPGKDVDGLNTTNIGRLLTGETGFAPCTPLGVMKLLHAYGLEPSGKRAVVIGRSVLVGKPMALLLLAEDATVTVCHSHTQGLASITREADILVVAVGMANFVTADMVKPGAAVIDVGINRTQDGLVGDVQTQSVAHVAGHLTPVPGGVGPMTVAMLLHNTLQAAQHMAR